MARYILFILMSYSKCTLPSLYTNVIWYIARYLLFIKMSYVTWHVTF